MPLKEDLRSAVVEIRYDEVGNLVEEALNDGLKPLELIDELREGLKIVGEKYNAGEYFLSELYMAAETMNTALEILRPQLLSEKEARSEGKIVIGSIEGDIHDFGKIIISSLMTASGYDVVDIGIDVPPEKFVDCAEKVGADVIGISALLSTTQPTSKKVTEELVARGLRSRYKVILGGTGVDPENAVDEFGVDAAVNDGSEGMKIISHWIEEKRKRA